MAMEPPELSARLRYLHGAAHLLATTSPITSRHLVSRHNALMFDSKLDLSDEQKTKACGACGTIMLLGWEATLENDIRRKQGQGDEVKEATKQPKAMVYSCGTCSKKTRMSTGIAKAARRNRKVSNHTSIPAASAPQSQASQSSTLSQKPAKRKSRKKGVLESILARNQPKPTNAGFGLDLSDFMKKS
ncbi:hypothetical protein IFR04_002822 [Cadophora malorum]|uniref:Rpr2-domain-containing protein n=1 Tax=Cadophora malorum TaxID=108018 RepID=A0A8H8BTX4_9HELO|nr:hypothetical protein IFR04_002822 [Cadophora malorum]